MSDEDGRDVEATAATSDTITDEHVIAALSQQLSAEKTTVQALLAVISQKDFRIEQLRGWLTGITGSRAYRLAEAIQRVRGLLSGRGDGERVSNEILSAAADPSPQQLQDPRRYLSDGAGVDAPGATRKSLEYHRRIDRADFLRLATAARKEGRQVFVQSLIIDWGVPLYQRPQHMAVAMAQEGALVLYLTANMRHDRVDGYEEIADNLFVTNDIDVVYEISGAIVSFYSTVSPYTPESIELVRSHGNRVVYEYVDHFDPKISSHNTDNLIRNFASVSDETYDRVVVTARDLVRDLEGRVSDDNLIYLPNGVDCDHYETALETVELPEPMAAIVKQGKPIIGYFGALAPWLWYDAINHVAARRPDWNIVLLGPDYMGGSVQLVDRPNVHALGEIEYKQLVHYARHFDIAMIPFEPGEIARKTSPLKLFEYFALRKPVVVTSDMRECVDYKGVFAAPSPEDFVTQMASALAVARDKDLQATLGEQARQNSWRRRAAVLIDSLQPPELMIYHIPKTAGTSLRSIIEDNFRDDEIAYYYPPDTVTLDLSQETSAKVVIGHLSVGEAGGSENDRKRVTFLRDPVERVVSQLRFDAHYFKNNSSVRNDHPFKEWFTSGTKPLSAFIEFSKLWYFDNCMTRMLSGVRDSVPFGQVEWKHYQEALHNVRGFAFVGFQEFFDEDLRALGRKFGLRVQPVHKNKARSEYSIDVADVGNVAEINYYDSLLYYSLLRERLARANTRRRRRVATVPAP
ncbi:MAG TPA: glycosyltransferase [Gammaproteobacteria bacterium]|nr:glycosyltransferase [Gammaproteobacteria bacterium]